MPFFSDIVQFIIIERRIKLNENVTEDFKKKNDYLTFLLRHNKYRQP